MIPEIKRITPVERSNKGDMNHCLLKVFVY